MEIPKAAGKSCKQEQYGNENDTALHVYRPMTQDGVAESGMPEIVEKSKNVLVQSETRRRPPMRWSTQRIRPAGIARLENCCIEIQQFQSYLAVAWRRFRCPNATYTLWAQPES
ncbi:MAG: hypothetical protein ACREDA_06030 [Methylocella sp.]